MPVADGKRESPLMLDDVFHDGLDIADLSLRTIDRHRADP